ncbi:Os02g0545700 [Oryza sativa Japonica Group]|uniref:Os02g0545700 protein n=1 Tax=Oryza sativa subsp. japonica TaxID=39947 RepID=Q0E0J5_ORYSJ|nr:Os02g0545700 [Oryza sativa Japonica Group]|eukprot:NP_001047079.1 Os02g0545700 [Oryza sativa Japonica Group]
MATVMGMMRMSAARRRTKHVSIRCCVTGRDLTLMIGNITSSQPGCGLGAGEVTCAVDKCKEELSRLSMMGMRRSRGGLNLMDKILAVWEAFGIWQAPESVVNSLPCKSYKKQTAQCSDNMEQ